MCNSPVTFDMFDGFLDTSKISDTTEQQHQRCQRSRCTSALVGSSPVCHLSEAVWFVQDKDSSGRQEAAVGMVT